MVLGDLGGWAFGDAAAEVEDDEVLAGAHNEAHVVVDEQDRQTFRVQALQDVEQAVLLGLVHPCGGLVE